jgi:three-Cys-motif partner protein
MKKDNQLIHSHTKEKLQVYKSYLDLYLTILLNNKYICGINIYEPFAGYGKYDNDDGSALISCKIISEKQIHKNIPINLFLNDTDIQAYNSLQNHCNKYTKFITKQDASDFINSIFKDAKNKYSDYHKFYFIDPYGYSQIKIEDIQKLLQLKKTELLFFIPISHIYRFRKATDLNPSISQFIDSYQINTNNINTENDLIDNIEESFKKIFSTNPYYICSYPLTKKTSSNKYSLFFISQHILGAEKFLELCYKIRKDGDLFGTNPLFEEKNINKLYQFIKSERAINNIHLYEYLIKNSCLPKHFTEAIKEKRLKNIKISNNNKNYNINYKNYKDKKVKTLFEILNGEQYE